jgi:ACS family hexuronate transporter-like MFS transporter
VRTAFCFGEGPFSAAANKLVSNWFPRHQIATAIGLANAGTPIGGALSGPVAGWLALRYGWRASFVVLACIGFFWTLFWTLAVVDKPEAHKRMSNFEREEIEGARPPIAAHGSKLPLSFYLRHPAIIATAISFFGYAYILYFFLTWFPSYLTMARHLSIRDMGFLNTIPWILGTVGLAISGLICDFLSRISSSVLNARKLVLVVCLSVAAICVSFAGLVSGLAWAVTLMAAALFFIYLTGATYWAILQEIVHKGHMGATSGFVHLIANCAGIIGPAVTGFIVQKTRDFTIPYVLAGGIALTGALLVSVFVKPIEVVPK